MDAQQQHDLKMSKGIKLTDGSKERLEALLIKKSKSQKKKALSELDPIARAI